jgi:hypothetical protein
MLNDGHDNFIKAVAWDQGTASNVTRLYFEDGQGHTATYMFPGVHPDIVLGDDRNNPGQIYRAAVIYIRSGGYVVMDFYRLVGLGTPSFTVNYVSTVPLSNTNIGPLYNTSMNPHIDMWSDANNRVNGYPGMYEFAVTWNERNNLYYNWGNIAAGTLNLAIGGAQVNGSLATNGRKYCDVACYTNVATGQPLATFCTGEYVAPWSCDLVAYTLDFTSGIPSLVGTNSTNFQDVMFPRIEAMNQYDPTTLATPWQIVSSEQTAVWTYNTGGTYNLTNALLPSGNFKSPAIAAGVGPFYGNKIGNVQYTPGYFEWTNALHTPAYYAHVVDANSGSVTNPNYFIINSGTVWGMPQYWLADASKSLALSNCSNSGDMLFSVWYDGRDVNALGSIWYKLSSNTVPMQFKQAPIATLTGITDLIYPNPAKDKIYLSKAAGMYRISNIAWLNVMEGKWDSSNGIDIQALPAGVYILQTEGRTYKFTKL